MVYIYSKILSTILYSYDFASFVSSYTFEGAAIAMKVKYSAKSSLYMF